MAKTDPKEVVHIQPKPGETLVIGELAYGDRATPQVRRGDLGAVEGKYDVLEDGTRCPTSRTSRGNLRARGLAGLLPPRERGTAGRPASGGQPGTEAGRPEQ